jgi:hypothetical protein
MLAHRFSSVILNGSIYNSLNFLIQAVASLALRGRYSEGAVKQCQVHYRSYGSQSQQEETLSRRDDNFDKDGVRIAQLHDDALVLSLKINSHRVRLILIDNRCYVFGYFYQNKIYYILFDEGKHSISQVYGVAMVPKWLICIQIEFGTPPYTISLMIDFFIANVPSTYNDILGRKTLYKISATIFIPYLKIKFPLPMVLETRVVTSICLRITMCCH